MRSLFWKEVYGFLDSAIARLVIGVFALTMGLLVWVLPQSTVLDKGYAEMNTVFQVSPYVLMFLLSALSMRSFAEERSQNSLILLLTSPLTPFKIVLGKYLSILFLMVMALGVVPLYYVSLYLLGSPVGNIDGSAVLGSFSGLMLLGGTFAAMGLMVSLLCRSQVVSFVSTATLCFVGYDGPSWMSMRWGMGVYYDSLSRGLISTPALGYFVALIALFLFTATQLLHTYRL